MTKNPQLKPKLTDEERHQRFVETAREVEASDDAKDFDKAFEKITHTASEPERLGVRVPPSNV